MNYVFILSSLQLVSFNLSIWVQYLHLVSGQNCKKFTMNFNFETWKILDHKELKLWLSVIVR